MPFLLLPAEIRNIVYELLYEHAEPLHIVEADDRHGKMTLHRHEWSGKMVLRQHDKRRQHGKVLAPIIEYSPDPARSLHVAAFLVSRQFYQEASSVFYMNNTFVLIRMFAQTTHWSSDKNYLSEVAVPWIRQLGTRASMLRNIKVDLGYLCPSSCASAATKPFLTAERTVDFGPLLCTLWSMKLDKVKITVAQSMGMYLDKWPRRQLFDCGALTKLVGEMFAGPVNLGRYYRTIGHIRIDTFRETADVAFYSETHRRAAKRAVGSASDADDLLAQGNYSHLRRSRSGGNLQLQPHPRCTFESLPFNVEERIAQLLLSEQKRHRIINLDNVAGRRNALGPYYITRRWRRFYAANFLDSADAPYTFKVSSTTRSADFPGFDSLGRLLTTRFDTRVWSYPDMYVWPNGMADPLIQFGSPITASISINFDLEADFTLRDVRFDIGPLIWATMVASHTWPVTVTLRSAGSVSSIETTLQRIRRTALRAWPPVTHDSIDIYPEIWVSGLLQVIEVKNREATGSQRARIAADEHDYEKIPCQFKHKSS